MTSQTYLEESLQPPYLEDGFARQYSDLEDAPPLNPRVGALRRVPMRPLPDDNVALLFLDLAEQLGECADLALERILRRLAFGHVDDTMHVENDFLAVRTPRLIAEAVDVLAISAGSE